MHRRSSTWSRKRWLGRTLALKAHYWLPINLSNSVACTMYSRWWNVSLRCDSDVWKWWFENSWWCLVFNWQRRRPLAVFDNLNRTWSTTVCRSALSENQRIFSTEALNLLHFLLLEWTCTWDLHVRLLKALNKLSTRLHASQILNRIIIGSQHLWHKVVTMSR